MVPKAACDWPRKKLTDVRITIEGKHSDYYRIRKSCYAECGDFCHVMRSTSRGCQHRRSGALVSPTRAYRLTYVKSWRITVGTVAECEVKDRLLMDQGEV